MPAPHPPSPRSLRSRPREPDRAAVWSALAGVRDPELDEAVTELGFVSRLAVHGSRVAVRLRLPTYFCAPNFAFLMAADARAAVQQVEGVTDVDVQLDEHFASDEINTGVAGGRDFRATFVGLADSELDDLRDTFRRKAMIARQYRLARRLLLEGTGREELTDLRIADLPDTDEVGTYLHRRAELGLDTAPEAAFLVDARGAPVRPSTLDLHLGTARTTQVSIEANAGFCRGLLATRYGAGPATAASGVPPTTPPTGKECP